MSAYFITATGTGVGKTFITSLLLRQLRRDDNDVIAFKPIISGYTDGSREESDTGLLLKSMGLSVDEPYISETSPWRFMDPLSPDMAGRRAGKMIKEQELYPWTQSVIAEHWDKIVLIEGVGGVMVPINSRITVLDWMKAISLPVILVTGTYLGTLSHTLTAYESLKKAGLLVHAIVINESENGAVSAQETIESLKPFMLPDQVFVIVPRTNTVDRSGQILPDITSIVRS
jgi:dethiobiotin synthetase